MLAERIISVPGAEHTANHQTNHSRTLVEAHFPSKLCYLFTHTFHWLLFQNELVHLGIISRKEKQVWSCWQWAPQLCCCLSTRLPSFLLSHVLCHLQSVSDTGQSVQHTPVHSLAGWDCTWGPQDQCKASRQGYQPAQTLPTTLHSGFQTISATDTLRMHRSHRPCKHISCKQTWFFINILQIKKKPVKIVYPVRGFFSSLHSAQGAAKGGWREYVCWPFLSSTAPQAWPVPSVPGKWGLDSDISWSSRAWWIVVQISHTSVIVRAIFSLLSLGFLYTLI